MKCKACGARVDEVGPLSWRGLCPACGEGHVRLNNKQLEKKSGPQYEHWRRRLAAGVGAVLLDDLPRET